MPLLVGVPRLKLNLNGIVFEGDVVFETPAQIGLRIAPDKNTVAEIRKATGGNLQVSYRQGNYECSFITKFRLEDDLLTGESGIFIFFSIPGGVGRSLNRPAKSTL
jgi:hypothetical protein